MAYIMIGVAKRDAEDPAKTTTGTGLMKMPTTVIELHIKVRVGHTSRPLTRHKSRKN